MTRSSTLRPNSRLAASLVIWAMIPLALGNVHLAAGCVCPDGHFSTTCHPSTCQSKPSPTVDEASSGIGACAHCRGLASQTRLPKCCRPPSSCCQTGETGEVETADAALAASRDASTNEATIATRSGCVLIVEAVVVPAISVPAPSTSAALFDFALEQPAVFAAAPPTLALNHLFAHETGPPPMDLVIVHLRLTI